jgi:hypothetical protein
MSSATRAELTHIKFNDRPKESSRPFDIAKQRRNDHGSTAGNCALAKFNNYSVVFPAFFALAHLAFAKAASRALPAADILLFGFSAVLALSIAVSDIAAPLFAAHRFATPARMFARPAALIFRFFLRTGAFPPRSFAHLALAAAEIEARPAALIPCFFLPLALNGTGVSPPSRSEFSSDCSPWICSCRSAAALSCVGVREVIAFIIGATVNRTVVQVKHAEKFFAAPTKDIKHQGPAGSDARSHINTKSNSPLQPSAGPESKNALRAQFGAQ